MHTASFFTTLIAARLHGIEGIDVSQKTTATNQRGGLVIDEKGVEASSNSTGCGHHGPVAGPGIYKQGSHLQKEGTV